MPATGIVLADESIKRWSDMRFHSHFRYAIFNFDDQLTTVQMTKVADPDKTLDDLIDELPANDVCYVILQYNYLNDEGDKRFKTVFISWAPDTCTARKKMVCAGTKSAVKRSLPGIAVDIHATSLDDITDSAIRARCLAYSH